MSLVLDFGLLAVGLFFGWFARDFFKMGPGQKIQDIQKKTTSNIDLIDQKMAEVEKKMDYLNKVLEGIDFIDSPKEKK
jgi:hypothetical protein